MTTNHPDLQTATDIVNAKVAEQLEESFSHKVESDVSSIRAFLACGQDDKSRLIHIASWPTPVGKKDLPKAADGALWGSNDPYLKKLRAYGSALHVIGGEKGLFAEIDSLRALGKDATTKQRQELAALQIKANWQASRLSEAKKIATVWNALESKGFTVSVKSGVDFKRQFRTPLIVLNYAKTETESFSASAFSSIDTAKVPTRGTLEAVKAAIVRKKGRKDKGGQTGTATENAAASAVLVTRWKDDAIPHIQGLVSYLDSDSVPDKIQKLGLSPKNPDYDDVAGLFCRLGDVLLLASKFQSADVKRHWAKTKEGLAKPETGIADTSTPSKDSKDSKESEPVQPAATEQAEAPIAARRARKPQSRRAAK